MIRHALKASDAELADFCCRNAIRKLSFFGSILCDDFGPDSDVDVLVEFEPGARVSLLDMSRMQRELSALLGRKADLLTTAEVHPHIRRRILASAEVQYAREG